MKAKINIKSSEIYDVGLKLEFNGEGYLNDLPIENNHVITEEGKYSLTVVGSSAKKVIDFTVKKLTVDGVAISYNELELNEIMIISSDNKENKILATETNFIEFTNTSSLVFAVIIASILIGISVIIPLKWRKK